MASTQFSAGTVITSEWLNEVNKHVFGQPAVSPKDFGAVGNGQAEDGEALRLAIAAAKASGRTLDLGSSLYKVSAPVVIEGMTTFHIVASGATILGPEAGSLSCLLEIKNCTDITIRGRLGIAGRFNASLQAGLWIHADAGASTTSIIEIGSLAITGCRLAYRIGDAAFPDKAISEISIVGGYTYGCPSVLRAEGTQTVVSVVGATLASDYGSGNATWTAIPQTTIEALGAYVRVVGGEVLHASDTSGAAFSVQPVTSAMYGNPYGSIICTNVMIETAARLAIATNPTNIAAPTVGRLEISNSGGYHPANSFAFIETDASYPGEVVVSNCKFYAGVARTQPTIQCANEATHVYCDDVSFGANFLANLRGIVGGTPHFSERLLLNVNAPNHAIASGVLTPIKYQTIVNANDATRYTSAYSASTGVFTVPAGGLKDVAVQCGFAAGATTPTDVFLVINGALEGTAMSCNGPHGFVGFVQSLAAGDTICIHAQPHGAGITPPPTAFNHMKIVARN